MPAGNRHFKVKDSGKTVIEALVLCAVLALLACQVLPALSKDRDDARTARCAANQKQLGQAAHQYAADFEGKFFYNWPDEYSIDREYQPENWGYWCDRDRSGRYLKGSRVSRFDIDALIARGNFSDPKQARERFEKKWVTLGGGVYACPQDEGGIRSYEQNYWASGVDPKEPLPEGQNLGAFFDSNSDAPLDKLLLFTDTVSSQPTKGGWVPAAFLGRDQLPYERFAGSISGMNRYADVSVPVVIRFGESVITDLDYVRHGTNSMRSKAIGSINIAYADGHVDIKSDSDLYDLSKMLSTYMTLWSPIDRQLSGDIQ